MSKLLQIKDPLNKNGSEATVHKSYSFGLDFGTTYCSMCLFKDNTAYFATEKTATDKMTKLIPSAVALNKHGIQAVGTATLLYQNNSEFIVIKSIKKLLAINTKDKIAQLNLEKDQAIQYILCPATNLASIKVFNKIYTCVDIATTIMHYMATIARKSIPGISKINNIVVTVPAYFTQTARHLIKLSAQKANLNVMRIINEPTAAALCYGLDKKEKSTYLIYDLGGGTFDASLLRFENGLFQILATNGDLNLGGDDFDFLLANQIKKHAIEEITYQMAIALANQIKHHLTNNERYDTTQLQNSYSITQTEYGQLITPLLNKTIIAIKQTIRDAKCQNNQIDSIVLIGGSTRTVAVRKILEQNFSCPILDNVNPDTSVAYGAAIQAAILDKRYKKQLLIDVAPLSLGIETIGNLTEKIIERNTPIPTKQSIDFTTFKHNQTGIILNIVQGERELADQCQSIGKLEINNIPLSLAGQIKITVEFAIDVDGILTITSNLNGNKQMLMLNPTYNLKSNTIGQMILSGIEHNKDDFSQRQYINSTTNAMATLIHSEFILEQYNNIENKNRQDIEKLIIQLKSSIHNKEPMDKIVNLHHQLENIMQIIVQDYMSAMVKTR